MAFLLLVLCTLAFCLVPHHRRKPDSFKPCTLAGVYRDLASEMPDNLNRGAPVVLLVGLAGLLACFYPALLPLMLNAGVANGWFIAGGLIVLLGLCGNIFAMLLSHMSFGFGASNKDVDITVGMWVLVAMQGLAALGSFAFGISSAASDFATRWLLTLAAQP